jgi:hypothetical protein
MQSHLFKIFINGLCARINNSVFLLFADVQKIYLLNITHYYKLIMI